MGNRMEDLSRGKRGRFDEVMMIPKLLSVIWTLHPRLSLVTII